MAAARAQDLPHWPYGTGVMAARIRAHDWAATPLGPIARWPQSLKTVVDLMLASPSMMSLVWGADAIHLYNDQFTELLREHHAQALGRSALETFAEARDVFAADLAAGMAGRSARLLAQRYPVLRGGRVEDAWFDVDYAPVRDDAGEVAGVLWTLKETTAQVLAERVVRESEARHRLMVESWAQAVWETDGDGVVVADSPSWRAYTGQTLEQWLGDGWLDAIHPDDRAYAERRWREATAAHSLVDAEFRLCAPDGGWRWTNVRAAPVLDQSGGIEKWVGMNIDIDARKRAEAARAESEAKYRDLFERIDEGFCIVEVVFAGDQPVDYRFLEVNPAFERQTGIEGGQGRLMRDVAPEHEQHWFDRYGEIARTGVPQRFEASAKQLGDRWYELNAFRVGEPEQRRVAIIFNDVTQRHRYTAALRASEERLRGVLDAMAEGFASLDADFTIREVNKETLRLDGRTREELVGRSHWEAFPGTEHSPLGAMFKRVASERVPGALEHAYDWPDGRTMWVDARAYPTPDGGVAVFWRDITDRKAAADALRESEERYRALFESMDEGYCIIRMIFDRRGEPVDHLFVEANEALEKHSGLKDVVGKRMLEMVPDHERKWFEIYGRVALTGEPIRFEQAGEHLPNPSTYELYAFRIGDPERREVAVLFIDIGPRRRAEAALLESERRLQTLVEGVPQLVWRAVDGGRWTWASPQWTAFTGQAESDSHDWGWLDPIHPDDRDRVREVWAGATERGEYHADYRSCHQGEDRYRWFQSRATPVRDDGDAIIEWLGTSTDVDDLRSLQERQRVLVAELQHRTRNLMGVVRSTADRTGETSRDYDDFRRRFRDRLEALARVQGLLSRLNEADRIAFDELIRTEIAAMHGSGERVTLDGPPGIRLRSSMVQTLAMALHELATNAIKYGALGQPNGHLAISWGMVGPDRRGRPRLRIRWRESGVKMPAAGTAPQGGGQGRELIERALPYQLGAETSFELGRDGVDCTITIPVSASNAVENANG